MAAKNGIIDTDLRVRMTKKDRDSDAGQKRQRKGQGCCLSNQKKGRRIVNGRGEEAIGRKNKGLL